MPSCLALLSRWCSFSQGRIWTCSREGCYNMILNIEYLAILCDLFGMVKWPFKGLSDLQLGNQKVTLNHLVPSIYSKCLFYIQPSTVVNVTITSPSGGSPCLLVPATFEQIVYTSVLWIYKRAKAMTSVSQIENFNQSGEFIWWMLNSRKWNMVHPVLPEVFPKLSLNWN